jgi:pimeloyl-ACP methyl ester carboxylesterase
MRDDDNLAPVVLLPGLTYDRRHFEPLTRELAALDPARRVLSLDLPGHRDRPRRDSYRVAEVASVIHDEVTAAGIDGPVVLVGHSISGVIATEYAARFPASAVLNLDQPLLPGPFGAKLRELEPVLRGPGWRQVWDGMLAGMAIDTLPLEARSIAGNDTEPRQDLLLGYWDELLHESDSDVAAQRSANLRAIAERGTAYHWVSSFEPPEAYPEWLSSLLPKVEITVMPGSHFPHLERPAEIARMVIGR